MEKKFRSSCLFSVKIKFYINIHLFCFSEMWNRITFSLMNKVRKNCMVFISALLVSEWKWVMWDFFFFALCIMCIYFSIVILGSNFCSSDRHTSLQDLKWVDWLMAFSASPGAQPFVTPEFILGYYSLVFMVFSSLIIVIYITFLFWLPCCVPVLLL